MSKAILTTDYADRKNTPICTGVIDYFPDALEYLARYIIPKRPDDATYADMIAILMPRRGHSHMVPGLRITADIAMFSLMMLQGELMGLPSGSWYDPDAEFEKQAPDGALLRRILKPFALALSEVAKVSAAGSAQHHPGQPLHWDRAKSKDESDALVRHLIEAGTIDIDGLPHSAKVAWRALAMLQKELESERPTETKAPSN